MEIYMTINLINNKKYVGRDAKSNPKYLGSGYLLKKAIKKYGKENFIKITLELLPKESTKEELRIREYYWLEKFNVSEDSNFYNISMKNGGMGIGDTHSDESKDLISRRTSEEMLKIDFVREQRHRVSKSSKGRVPYNKGKKVENRKVRKKNKNFTNGEIIDIRNLYEIGESASGLSKKFDCSHHTITKIINYIKPYSNEY